MRLSTWDERRGLASSAIASPSRPLVLQTWWGGGILERPYSALELQHQQPVVLAGRPDRSALGIQVDDWTRRLASLHRPDRSRQFPSADADCGCQTHEYRS